MAIEFRCTKCNKLLRTADNTAGKHAKCPECGEILVIPAGGIPPAAPPPSSPFADSGGFQPPPPSGSSGSSPFGAGSQPPFSAGAQPSYQPETGNPYQSPSQYAAMERMPMGDGEIRPTIVRLGDILSRTWPVLQKQWVLCLLGMFLAGISYLVGAFGLLIVPVVIGMASRSPIIVIGCMIVGYLLVFVFIAFLAAGFLRFLLGLARGDNSSIGDIYSGGPYIVSLFLVFLLLGLMTAGIYLLFVVPGIVIAQAAPGMGLIASVAGFILYFVFATYVWIVFSQSYFLVVDRNFGPIEALRISASLMKGNKLTYLLIVILMNLLFLVPMAFYIAGILMSVSIMLKLAFVGISFVLMMLIWIPLSLMITVTYLAITGQPTVNERQIEMGMR